MATMTERQSLVNLKNRFGADVRLEAKQFYLGNESSIPHVTLLYCWQGEVIKAVGGSWESLVSYGL